jgi:hypothetical protein
MIAWSDWMLEGFANDVTLWTLLHGNYLDELACLMIPMVLAGIVFLMVMRSTPPDDEESPRENDPEQRTPEQET